MGNRRQVGINQPELNGMAKTSEREIWSKGRALCCGVELKPSVIISLICAHKTLWHEFGGTSSQGSCCE